MIIVNGTKTKVTADGSARWHAVVKFNRVLDIHDDVVKWKAFPRYWPFMKGIHRSTVNSPQKRPVTRNFDVFFDLRPNKL